MKAVRTELNERKADIAFDSGTHIRANLGSQLILRIVGGMFIDASYFPVRIEVDVAKRAKWRIITIEVSESMGFGSMFGITGKYRKYCRQLLNELTVALVSDLNH